MSSPGSDGHSKDAFRVLVIDDEQVMLDSCRRILERQGLLVETTWDPFDGRDRAIQGDFDLVLLDLRMPDLDGMEILSMVRERRSDLEVIVITGHSTVEAAVAAVKLGAFDFLPKPFTPDELLQRVRGALDHRAESRAKPVPTHGPTMIGESPAMAQVWELVAKVAPTDATVLLLGETGTGKDLVAQAIHAASHRRDKPFVSMDCSALAPGLLESELFGHVKGSFTSAAASKPGLFEIAHRGTLFLDEAADISPETQGKLLRALETGEIRRVGDVETKKVDIRLIAATNRDLAGLVERREFRQDLFYRLNVVPIRLPALRERASDIPLLLRHFLARYQRPNVRCPSHVSPDALEVLQAYSWPGNVRELKNLVERLVVVTDGETIRIENLPAHVAQCEPLRAPGVPQTNEELKAMKRDLRDRVTHQIERTFVIEALRRSDWNVSQAARQTGLLRPNFHALMRKYRIRTEEYNPPPA